MRLMRDADEPIKESGHFGERALLVLGLRAVEDVLELGCVGDEDRAHVGEGLISWAFAGASPDGYRAAPAFHRFRRA